MPHQALRTVSGPTAVAVAHPMALRTASLPAAGLTVRAAAPGISGSSGLPIFSAKKSNPAMLMFLELATGAGGFLLWEDERCSTL